MAQLMHKGSARCSGRWRVIAGLLVLSANALEASAAVAVTDKRWVTYTSPDADLVFDYPSGVFTEQKGDPTDQLKARTPDHAGRIFTTADGRAALQVGTFPNLDGASVGELRKRAVAASYANAKLDYNRVAGNWYVISGTRGDETFYERVHFSCNNRRLDIWAMTYPTAEAQVFDPLVEEMSRRRRPVLANIGCK